MTVSNVAREPATRFIHSRSDPFRTPTWAGYYILSASRPVVLALFLLHRFIIFHYRALMLFFYLSHSPCPSASLSRSRRILNLLRLSIGCAMHYSFAFIIPRFHYTPRACLRLRSRTRSLRVNLVGRFLICYLLYSRRDPPPSFIYIHRERERERDRVPGARAAIIRSFSLCRRLYYCTPIIPHTGVFNPRYLCDLVIQSATPGDSDFFTRRPYLTLNMI